MHNQDKKYIIAIDLGGMSAKGALFSMEGELLQENKAQTSKSDGFEGTMSALNALCRSLVEQEQGAWEEVLAIGVGAPGIVDTKSGRILRWSNFDWNNVPFAETLSTLTEKKVIVSNDANVAALGEATFGATANYQSSILLTLGTGVGGGMIFDGKILEGYRSAGAELGHITIRKDGLPCACGRKGCYEKYASATALISQTRHAMVEDLNSKMWELVEGDISKVNGETPFTAAKLGDATAKKVIEEFVGFVSEGIADFANVLRPEAIVLGGGIANQGENLFAPLRKAVDERMYIAMDIVPMKIVGAKLGNRAGIYGAYCLAKGIL